MSVKRAIGALQKYYPVRYAESAWDNTGLLVDSLSTTTSKISILLTIDLTKSVVEEAIKHDVSLIIAYHPFIFRGIKKIEPLVNPQHESLVKLIQNGISVYSPHTAVDAAINGVNDWIIDEIAQGNLQDKRPIDCNDEDDKVGMGRVGTLIKPSSLQDLILVAKKTFGLQHLQVATKTMDKQISTIAVCAGSGSGVFSKLRTPADLYITGELSHHEVLALKESGSSVITVNHSNSERGYLRIMQENLQRELADEIIISATDCDPLVVV